MTGTPRSWPSSAGSSAKAEGCRRSSSQRLPCGREAVARRARRPRRAAPSPPVGRGDHTPPCWPVDRPEVPGKPGGLSTPIFFLGPQKENGGGAVKRKNAYRCAVTGAERPPAQRDAALNGSAQWTQPLREHGRGFAQTSGHGTPCCTLRSSGQRPNLTSFSFRAQSAAREVAATLCNHP